MESKTKKTKLWHRIKYRNSVAPTVAAVTSNNMRQFAVEVKRRHRILQYMNKVVKKTKFEEKKVKVTPFQQVNSTNDDIKEFCEKCPSTAMSRFLEKEIIKKVNARGVEKNYPRLLHDIIIEAREEFLKITQQSGIEMKLKFVEKHFRVGPYKHLGRTKNYPVFLQRRKELKSKFILHHPLIKRILDECVTKLPRELFNLNLSLKCQLDTNEFQKHIFDYANDAAQRLQEFYRKIVALVEHEKVNTQRARSYLGACTGLLSVNMSRTIAHTLLHVVSFTSKEHIPYLKLNISFKDRLILRPTAEEIIDIYNKFLRKIVESAKQFYVLEKYKLKGFENKQIHLCLTDEFFTSILQQIEFNINEKYEPILKYIKNLDDEFVDIYGDLCSGSAVSASDLIFDEGCKKLLYYKSYLPKVAFIPDNAFFTIGQLIITEYRKTLQQTLLDIIENIFNNLSAQHEWEINDICESFDIIYIRATQKPVTTEELIEIGKYMAWVRTEYLDKLKERIIKALACLTKLIQLGPLKENHIIINAKAINWLDEILPVLEENSTTYEQLKFEAEEMLQRVIEEINVDIKDVYPLLDILDSMDNIENVRNYLNTITLHMVKIKAIESKINWINREEVALSFPKSSYAEFDELKNYIYPFYHLLKLCLDVQRNLSVWLDGQFDLINYEQVKKTVEKYYKDLLKTQKVYRNKLRQAQDENLSLRFKGTVDDPDMLNWPAPLKLCSKAIKLIQDFEPSLEVIKIMCNEALMKRHWQKMSKVASFDITPNAGTTLRKIIQIDLKPDIDKYELISYSATKERELLENLEQMQREWEDVNFTTGDHKEIKIIIQMEDVEVVADDHTIKVINMLNSIHVKPYENQVRDFYNKLRRISRTMQECRQMQKQWLHFLPLFFCHKITIQMSEQAEIFKQITTTYTNYIEMIHSRPNVYITVNNTNILQDLLHCNQQFELINEGVNRYFAKIRQYLPRFYFVSNEEMFRILSLTKDPTQIHHFIRSLFYDIQNLRFNENFGIVGIVSGNNEILHLIQTVDTLKFQGCVEMWLKELENQITDSIRQMIQNSLKTHNQQKWILQWPCQILLAVTKIVFTLKGHEAIINHTLDAYEAEICDQIKHIIDVIKTNQLSTNTKTTLSSLLIMMNNNKNIIENLKSDQEFKWLSQLRYYQSDQDLKIKIFDNEVSYGYEYLGNNEQIVITPNTERCYYSIMLAYKYHLCANMRGPPNTGKTDTIKSLANALAVQCTLFYCSEKIKFYVIQDFLKGVASRGSWLVFEEFDKIQTEVCSILLQEISKISTSLKGKLDKVILNSTEIELRTCFIACTMKSPETFPEGFKVLFRPIVMMSPDYQTITQISLSSYGYTRANDLGKRVTIAYKLMKDLLPESKLDFGLRAMKDVLHECAKNFRSDSNEDECVCNSIFNIIMPKLSKTESTIFSDIMSHLFPTIKQTVITTDFRKKVTDVCQTLNLEPREECIDKSAEISEITKFKIGTILIGETLTGKTTLIKILAAVDNITVKVICPKTLTLNQLFGEFSIATMQWSDGVITSSLRDNPENEDWIILDGPADPLWVESLHSLLDDSQKICLTSGEILYVKTNKRILLEVDNLKQVSPALISRCGIIYLDSKVVGWKPLLTSWLQTSNFEWQKDFEENFTVLFDWVVPPCLDFVRTSCQQLCDINDISSVKTTIQVLEMLLIEAYVSIQKKEDDPKNLSSWIQASFIQAVIWGIGSNLDSDSRLKFDEFFKQLWKGQNKNHPYPPSLEKVEVSVPADEMIFDHSYFYKSKGNWKYWPDVLKNEKIEECDYLSDVFVPTNDTIKYAYLFNMHITYNYPVLLVGPSGTGKSVLMLDLTMNKLNRETYESIFLSFTSTVTANQTQEMVLSKLFKKKSGRYGPTEGKICVLYIDDFSEPRQDEFGTRSSLELIRQLLDHQKWYNLETFKPIFIDDINLMTTMTSTFKTQNISKRLLRHFNVFSINTLAEDSIQRIFSNVLLTKWKKIGFPSDIIGTINQIVSATYHFYKSVSNLKHVLEWNFYYFNMKNFSRVIQVCAMIRKESTDTNKKLFFKLWAYEMVRVLGDRMLEQDKNWLFDNIKYCVSEHFKDDFAHLFENLPKNENSDPDLSKILFGTYPNKTRFDETDIEKLQEIAVTCLREHNKDSTTKSDLVLFEYALEHLSNLCRVISIPTCNLIQVGMCGIGRETLTHLACLIYNQQFFQIELSENYNRSDWHKTMKSFLKEAGGYGKPCTFFLKEEQIVIDTILDDLAYIVKTGQVPFLYSLEEKQKILDLVRTTMQEQNFNVNEESESIFLYNQKRCRENLHIIIAFNPRNAALKKVLRAYPLFHKFFEINYLKNWPPESLQDIARVWTQELNITKEIKTKVINSFGYFHHEVEKISNSIHITTGSYLEFVRLYVNLVIFKQKKITNIKQRYLAALEKLSYAALQISEMQKSLADYQPQLEAMTIQAIEMAKQIETETIEVEKASDLVKKDEEIANEQAAAAQVLKLDCEADLAQAIPILEDAISALNTLKPTDITLVKSMKNPPDAIKLVMAAVCVIKDVKPDRIPDPSTGRKTIDYWGPSKRILGDMNFLQTLKDFDKDNIKPEIMVKIRKDYLPHKDFKPHIVAKASSAAEGLCKWIIAMDMYDKVAKEVAPKKEKLEKAEREYGTTMAILNEKKEQVTRIEQKLADLNALLKEATRKQQKLQRDVDICKKKLNRAQKLIGGLSEEKIRWLNAVDQLQKQYDNLPGDILISSAAIAYLGPFRADNRSKTLNIWIDYVRENEIPFKEGYSFIEAFEKDLDYDKWHLNGLPTDNYFVENAVIGKHAKRWSLYVDPQKQANTWIKISEKQNGLQVTKFSCPNFMNMLKECIISGKPLLVENVGETIKPFLSNLITKKTYVQNKTTYIKIGDEIVTYNDNFLFYMTTNLKFPHYSSEMYDKITIIDFNMNRESLEEHLLTCVVEVEKPTLKRVKKTLNNERKRNKDALYNIEEKILKTLSESKTDILEDEQALQILDESKILSKSIQEKQKASIEIETSLNNFRAGYEIVSKHATNLYFTISNLKKINYIYQFSYNWFIETYSESIQKAHKYKELTRRRKSLIETLTYEVYCKISRSIFEKDKLFFSFLLCINLSKANGDVTEEEINYFSKLGEEDKKEIEKSGPEGIPKECWEKLCELKKISFYGEILQVFQDDAQKFQNIYQSKFPERETFPEGFDRTFGKLLIVSIIRPDRLHASIEHYVSVELGSKYVNPPPFDIATSFTESYILSPIIFIIKPGSDPIHTLQNFAKTKNFHNKLVILSVKDGQEDEYENLIVQGKNLGLWICLQNCHLLGRWLPLLDLKLEEIDYSNTHENFRLWLTTNETTLFPVSLLERSVKITREPPRGVQNKLLAFFSDDPVNSPQFYTNCPGKHDIFVRLLYSIAFLHCVLQERKKFDPYGWNVCYNFNENDFLISIYELQNIINQRLHPLDEVLYLVKSGSYGGHIDNKLDKRLLDVIADDFLKNDTFVTNISIGLPNKTDHQDCISHILKLPNDDSSDIFGIHENYEYVRGIKESKTILESIVTEFREVIHNDKLPDCSQFVEQLLSELPSPLETETKNKKSGMAVIDVIISQEIKNCNQNLFVVKSCLQNLQKALQGCLLMTDELEEIYISVIHNRVPRTWSKTSHSLSAFIKTLNQKICYFQSFNYTPEQNIWLGSFSNPRSFLIGCKFEHSRRHSVQIDKIFFNIKKNTVKEGISVSGLHLIGATWDEQRECLDELPQKIINYPLPSLLFIIKDDNQTYKCPLYKTIDNDSLLLGDSSNFILSVFINSEKPSEHWIKRGTSLLCQI